jgi:single-strand DNA-binding protein
MVINNVIIAGNLSQDPILKYTPAGTPICTFSVALNRQYTDKKTGNPVKDVSFVSIQAWGKTAEICNQYLNKGKSVCIEGELKQDRWESEGKKQSKLYVIAQKVHFLSPKENKTSSNPGDLSEEPSISEDDL